MSRNLLHRIRFPDELVLAVMRAPSLKEGQVIAAAGGASPTMAERWYYHQVKRALVLAHKHQIPRRRHVRARYGYRGMDAD